MDDETVFLTVEQVTAMHDDQIAQHGGTLGIRSQSLLESAVAMAQQGFGGEYLHKSLFEMAAAYAFHIAENQPFLDGNKRTALVAALAFLHVNGVELVADDEERATVLYTAMMNVAAHDLDKEGLALVFKVLEVTR